MGCGSSGGCCGSSGGCGGNNSRAACEHGWTFLTPCPECVTNAQEGKKRLTVKETMNMGYLECNTISLPSSEYEVNLIKAMPAIIAANHDRCGSTGRVSLATPRENVNISNLERVLAVANPNFSIIVPAKCNAKCKFCFWKPSDIAMNKSEYLNKVSKQLEKLPSTFRQCSVTGGEPTMLEYLPELLSIVRNRFEKVVLSSNGYRMSKASLKFIDHLNISRHHYDENKNAAIFQTNTMPTNLGLQHIGDCANELGVDVTFNCVLDSEFSDANFINLYVDYAKDYAANYVCFRKEHGTLYDLPVETYINSKAIDDGSCPVCRSKIRYINGMKTTWRYSVAEPSILMQAKGIYELVMQPNGNIFADWDEKLPVNF